MEMFNFLSEVSEEAVVKSEVNSAEELTEEAAYNKYIQKCSGRILRDPTVDLSETGLRYSGILPKQKICNKCIAIIGLGGLGNKQWKEMMSIGAENIYVFDDDDVDVVNVDPQGHDIATLGMPKADAVYKRAFEYKFVSIHAYKERVMTLEDIERKTGITPDIIIGCTDSYEFRNSMWKSLEKRMEEATYDSSKINTVPEVFFDIRMSSGEWTCYSVPCRILSAYGKIDIIRNNLGKYGEEAFWNSDDAEGVVHDPCTIRGMSAAGSGAAIYTTMYLIWYIMDFYPKVKSILTTDSQYRSSFATDAEFDLMYDYFNYGTSTKFHFKISRSERTFENITPDNTRATLIKKNKELRDKLYALESEMVNEESFVSRLMGRKVKTVTAEVKLGEVVIVGNDFVKDNKLDNGITYLTKDALGYYELVCRKDGILRSIKLDGWLPAGSSMYEIENPEELTSLEKLLRLGAHNMVFMQVYIYDLPYIVDKETILRGLHGDGMYDSKPLWNAFESALRNGDPIKIRVMSPYDEENIPEEFKYDSKTEEQEVETLKLQDMEEGLEVVLPKFGDDTTKYRVVEVVENGIVINYDGDRVFVAKRYLEGAHK